VGRRLRVACFLISTFVKHCSLFGGIEQFDTVDLIKQQDWLADCAIMMVMER